MKKFLGILVLGLFLNVNVFANELTGKKLVCENELTYQATKDYYLFVSEKKVKKFYVSAKTLKVVEFTSNVTALPKLINIYWGETTVLDFTINRETLMTSKKRTCEVINLNIKNHLNKISKDLLEEVTKSNKI